MPLRDHFHPPTSRMACWDAVHGGWPAMIVISLADKLPRRYVAHPRVKLAHEAETDPAVQDEYEVRVFDIEQDRRLVAAVELVSPSNKNRPENRRVFVARCAALLKERVSVTIVDLVTIRNQNLYGELLDFIDRVDPALGAEPPAIYAVACRATKTTVKPGAPWQLETWFEPLRIGQPLPTLPLWLADDLAVPLDLEGSYEETCRVLRIA
jgi:hypothetical protein